MMPELGNFLLCLALGISLLLSVYPQWGAVRQDTRLMALARPLSWMLFISVMAAFLILVYAFVVNDFTIMYVASNSNAELLCGIGWPPPGAHTKDRCCCGCC